MSGFKHGLNWLKRKSCYIYERGVDSKGFAIIRYKALFRLDTALLKKLGESSAGRFLKPAAEMLLQQNLYGQSSIEKMRIIRLFGI